MDKVTPASGFACPICGDDKPHHHTAPVVGAYQMKGSRPAPMQCPKCGVGGGGHDGLCPDATVLTLGGREAGTALATTPPTTNDAIPAGMAALIEPWKNHHGPLPDFDSPVACVFDSGVQYAVELLAKELGVTDWTPCDGTEEYDGDLGGTMMNIVREAMPLDQDGERMWPSEVCAALSAAPSAPATEAGEGA